MNILIAFWIINSSLFTEKDCHFNKEGLSVFINALSARGALREDADVYFINYGDIDYKCFFLDTVTVKERRVKVQIVDTVSEQHDDLLTISAVRVLSDSSLSVIFNSSFGSALYSGSVNMTFENEHPVFRTAYIIKRIQ